MRAEKLPCCMTNGLRIGRGLKPLPEAQAARPVVVSPHAGAWIEASAKWASDEVQGLPHTLWLWGGRSQSSTMSRISLIASATLAISELGRRTIGPWIRRRLSIARS